MKKIRLAFFYLERYPITESGSLMETTSIPPENGLGRKANSLPKLKESEAYYIPKCDCGRETVCVFSIKHSLFLASNHILSLVQI